MPVGNLVGFTDRPNREVRGLTPTDFAALWTGRSDDSFSADPPNASLTYWDSDGTNAVAHTVIVEITKDVSGAGNVMSMTLRILSPSGAVLPTKMYRASLFIDGSKRIQQQIQQQMEPWYSFCQQWSTQAEADRCDTNFSANSWQWYAYN